MRKLPPVKEKKVYTQQAVAAACNLSRATVGKVLAGGKDALLFSEETRNRVWDSARLLGYRPNRAAQIIRRGRSNLVAVIYFNSSNEVGWRAAETLPGEIKALGYDYLVFDYQWHGGSMDAILREVIQLRVEGVVLLGLPAGVFTMQYAETLRECGIVLIALDVDDRLPGVASTYCDSQTAFRDLTAHLLGLGHRSILNLTYEFECRSKSERLQGFKEGFASIGRCEQFSETAFFENWPNGGKTQEPTGLVVELACKQKRNGYRDGVYHFCRHLFASGQRPDAIMCSNDVGAMAAFMAAHEFGLRIPNDVAVTGYDDDSFASFPMFDLTTARQNVKESSLSAIEDLSSLLKGASSSFREKVFQPSLVLRGSCGRRLGRKTKAFTLVELLVCLLIVSLLAALLLAGVSRVREAANSAVCAGNLRTLGGGFSSYIADHDGYFPNYGRNGGPWTASIAEYGPRRAFFCPTEKKQPIANAVGGNDKIWTDNYYTVSYGYNARYLSPDFLSQVSKYPIQYGNILHNNRSASVILLADAGRLNSDGTGGWGFYYMEPPALQYGMPLPRHNGYANVLWVDGSVSKSQCVLTKQDGYKYLTERNWDPKLP